MEDTENLPEPTAAFSKNCKNCSAPITGFTYCQSCGQKTDTHTLTFRELINEFMDGLFNLDSRMWHSLVPLVALPGRLTNEYLAGRRMYYLPPFRLYLILSVLFFLMPNVNQTDLDINQRQPDSGIIVENDSGQDAGAAGRELGNQIAREVQQELGEELAREMQQDTENSGDEDTFDCTLGSLPQGALTTILLRNACLKFNEDPQQLIDQVVDSIPVMMIVGIPLVALFMQLVYFFSRRFYVEHVIFLLHAHAFYFLVSIIISIAALSP